MKDIALVYMVAGISSRFGGKIKAFAEIGPNNESLIEYSLSQALPAGFNKIVLIVGENTKEPFKQKFGQNYHGIPIEYALQTFDTQKRERPWGTTDAVCSAKEFLNGPFVVCNGDDIYGAKAFKTLYDHLENNQTDATVGYPLGTVLSNQGGVNRGIFQVNEKNQIISLKENFNISKENLQSQNLNEYNKCSMNIFALQKGTLENLCSVVDNFKKNYENNPKIECLLPQEIGNLIKDNKTIMQLYPTNATWFGITRPKDVEGVRQALKKY